MEGRSRRAVFLDLNGTLVQPLKQSSLAEMTLISGADHAVRRLLDAGFTCPVVTVQARIEKGLFTEDQFREWFADFFGGLELEVEGPYVCPHRYMHRCPCEKPNTLLYEQAATDLSIDLGRSFVVGDSPQDVQAAERFGGTGCLVRTGWPVTDELLERCARSGTFVDDSIVDAADWILTRPQTPAA